MLGNATCPPDARPVGGVVSAAGGAASFPCSRDGRGQDGYNGVMTEPDAQAEQLSQAAEELLARLRQGHGRDMGVPSVYVGAMAFSSHAEAYLSNAALLCEKPDAHDFCIFGALYGVRHGLELWLKCLVINSMIDTALEEVAKGAASADAVAQALGLTKDQKRHLCRSLCILRNYCEDGLVYPDCIEQKIDPTWADKAVRFIQHNGQLERYKLATVWTVPAPGHDLLDLWRRVEHWIQELSPAVSAKAQVTGCGVPMPPEDLAAVCELIHRWDPGGDTFRYPLALDGRWNFELPSLSVRALGDLARCLQETAVGYENLLEESYAFSKLRSPQPSTGYL
jgi:hypothetical protein